MRAICTIKRVLRLQPNHELVVTDEADTPLASIWSPRFGAMLGSLQQFLRTRPDQFLVTENAHGLGYSVKDVTGNAVVVAGAHAISSSSARYCRCSKMTKCPGGLATQIVGSINTGMRNRRGHEGHPFQCQTRSRSRTLQFRSRFPSSDSCNNDYLLRVLGEWIDTRGSRYQVHMDEGGSSCTVRTTRPDGCTRQTKALIRLLPLGGLQWGERYVLDKGKLPAGQLRWLRIGSVSGYSDFEWRRL